LEMGSGSIGSIGYYKSCVLHHEIALSILRERPQPPSAVMNKKMHKDKQPKP
jgi:hypothetical protein